MKKPFLDIICLELKSGISKGMQAHYELCTETLIPTVIIRKYKKAIGENGTGTEVESRNCHFHQLLKVNCFTGSIIDSHRQCQMKFQVKTSSFITSENVFKRFLARIPMGSAEAERSFLCIRRLHTWLRNPMTTILYMDTESQSAGNRFGQKFMELQPRKMMGSPLFGYTVM